MRQIFINHHQHNMNIQNFINNTKRSTMSAKLYYEHKFTSSTFSFRFKKSSNHIVPIDENSISQLGKDFFEKFRSKIMILFQQRCSKPAGIITRTCNIVWRGHCFIESPILEEINRQISGSMHRHLSGSANAIQCCQPSGWFSVFRRHIRSGR